MQLNDEIRNDIITLEDIFDNRVDFINLFSVIDNANYRHFENLNNSILKKICDSNCPSHVDITTPDYSSIVILFNLDILDRNITKCEELF